MSFVQHLSETVCLALFLFVLVISPALKLSCLSFVTTNVANNALGHLHANDGVDEEEHGDQEDNVGECLE